MTEAIAPLRARVRLESPLRSADDIGGAAISWTDEGSVWAEIRAGAASSSAAFDTAAANGAFVIEIRTRADVRAGWRVVWGVRTFQIQGVRDQGGARIELVCAEQIL
jgi:SPP1 family predicted phage head-tail adaptor